MFSNLNLYMLAVLHTRLGFAAASYHLRAVVRALHGAGPSPHTVAVATALTGDDQTQQEEQRLGHRRHVCHADPQVRLLKGALGRCIPAARGRQRMVSS